MNINIIHTAHIKYKVSNKLQLLVNNATERVHITLCYQDKIE
jgi:hypothetical protein